MEAQAEPSPSILKNNYDPADFEMLKQATEEWVTLQRFATGDTVLEESIYVRWSKARVRIETLIGQVFRDCTELGPPTPITQGQLPNGDLVWVCGHEPQHLYDFQTGKLLT